VKYHPCGRNEWILGQRSENINLFWHGRSRAETR
jgi:hypothetical protein